MCFDVQAIDDTELHESSLKASSSFLCPQGVSCIRLSREQACPQCRQPTSPSHLRVLRATSRRQECPLQCLCIYWSSATRPAAKLPSNHVSASVSLGSYLPPHKTASVRVPLSPPSPCRSPLSSPQESVRLGPELSPDPSTA